jgi:hypothetical protein
MAWNDQQVRVSSVMALSTAYFDLKLVFLKTYNLKNCAMLSNIYSKSTRATASRRCLQVELPQLMKVEKMRQHSRTVHQQEHVTVTVTSF